MSSHTQSNRMIRQTLHTHIVHTDQLQRRRKRTRKTSQHLTKNTTFAWNIENLLYSCVIFTYRSSNVEGKRPAITTIIFVIPLILCKSRKMFKRLFTTRCFFFGLFWKNVCVSVYGMIFKLLPVFFLFFYVCMYVYYICCWMYWFHSSLYHTHQNIVMKICFRFVHKLHKNLNAFYYLSIKLYLQLIAA